jgi:signal peptidase I
MKMMEFIKKNKSFLVGIGLLFAVRWSFADQYRVPSESMVPTIQIGDHIAVNKMAYDLKIPFTNHRIAKIAEPARGDIVVFTWPGDHKATFVKRLVGLPGDHLHIEDGFLTINGQKVEGSLDETQILNRSASEPTVTYTETLGDHHISVQRIPWMARKQSLDIDVPEDHYFFMGDNRDNSADSRSWGFVSREALKGRALGTLWNIQFEDFLPKVDLTRIFKGAT